MQMTARSQRVSGAGTRQSTRPLAYWLAHTVAEAGPAPSPALSAAATAPQPLVTAVGARTAKPVEAYLRPASIGAISWTPASPDTISLSRTSVMVTVGEVCAVLGSWDTSLAVGRSLWINLPKGQGHGIRERVGQGEETERRGDAAHGEGARSLGPAGEGNAEPLTRGRGRNSGSGSRFSCNGCLQRGDTAAREHLQRVNRVMPHHVEQESTSSI